jgi:exopolyphosphatase/guanosine-5'-triphosphate,3'-diphosphate pyrophosphatase
VLDVGSNTVHLLVVDAHYGAAPLPAYAMKIPLRLAEHLRDDGTIDDDAVETLVDFVQRAQDMTEDLGVTEMLAFATSAVRDAPNGDEVLTEVRKRTGLELQTLSGDDEARLTFLAVRRWFGWSAGRLLVLDIGGGSLEIASGTDEEPDAWVSLPLGAGRLTRDRFSADPPPPDEVRVLRRDVRSSIGLAAGRILRAGTPSIAVGTSKTFRQLARIAGAAPSSEGFLVRRSLSRVTLADVTERISRMTEQERAVLPGVSEGRAAQLVAGAIVAEAAMDVLNVATLEICPWALREGLILRRLDGFVS